MPFVLAIGTLILFLFASLFAWQSVSDALVVWEFSGDIRQPLADRIADIVLVIGLVISALVSLVVFFVANFFRQAQFLAHRMTRDLMRSKEWFQRLYDRGPTPYLLLTMEGVVFQPNKAALRLFGADEKWLEGKSLVALCPEKDRDELEDVLKRFERGLPTNNKEILVEQANKAVRWVLFSLYPIGMAGRAPSGGLVTLVDINEQKRIEKAKTEFVSLASHQLRTPLSAIKWYTGILRRQVRDRLTDKQNSYLDKTFEANERMIQLINMLLNVSRIEIGSFVVHPTDVSTTEMVEALVDQLSPQIEEKNIRVNIEYEGKHSIYADANLLHIIVQNLISNAVKYTDRNGEIRIKIHREGDRIKLVIADTGCGIPKEEYDKVFSKMFRASNARRLSVQGTGLGLYIVKAVVEAMEGEISFTSEEGVGTTFTVSLPLVIKHASQDGKSLLTADSFT